MKLKGKVKVGHILVDDVAIAYKVLEVFKNCVIVAPIRNPENFACEIMSFESLENEGWVIANL